MYKRTNIYIVLLFIKINEIITQDDKIIIFNNENARETT